MAMDDDHSEGEADEAETLLIPSAHFVAAREALQELLKDEDVFFDEEGGEEGGPEGPAEKLVINCSRGHWTRGHRDFSCDMVD